MNETELQDALMAMLQEIACMDTEDLDQFDMPCELAQIERVSTFDEAGVMTRDAGLVITTNDGCCFQLTIIQSR